mmetsp:Transcript_10374/g.11451  ORF Transcript_10374/g.11451 Transcript_10374/m.11451 type:complete len:131 (-) Transcript_10374:47-439(-)
MKLTKKIAVATGSSADIEIDMIDASFRDTYASILLYVVDLRGANGEFQAEEIAEQHQDRVPTTTSPLEKAIVSQTIRVIWYTLVLDEEKIVFEEHDTAPRPNIPYGDSNNGSMSSSSGGGGGCGGKGFGK